mgnify:FL=1
MNLKYVSVFVAAASTLAVPLVFAQTQTGAQPASGPAYQLSGTSISGSNGSSDIMLTAPTGDAAPYKTESGIYLYPTVFVGMGYNDNLQSSATNQIQSNLITVAPKLIAELKRKGDRYTALASVNNTNYTNSSPDNATNSEFKVAGDNYFTSRARAAWSLGQVRSTDPRGSNNRPISSEPDRWTSNNAQGLIVYGAPEAQGRIEVDLGSQNKTYDNNRVNTAINDVSTNSFGSRLFYRIGTRSLVLGEYRNAKADYGSALSKEDNTDQRYYVGLTWDATAATTGIVKLGKMTKDFDAAGRDGFDGESWEATIRWSPLTYSVVDFQTNRSIADAAGFGNHQLTTGTNVTWNHRWNQTLSTRAGVGLLKTDFGGTSRTDNATNFGLAVDYSLLRWLKIGIDWSLTDNSSSVPTSAFKRNITMMTLNASL